MSKLEKVTYELAVDSQAEELFDRIIKIYHNQDDGKGMSASDKRARECFFIFTNTMASFAEEQLIITKCPKTEHDDTVKYQIKAFDLHDQSTYVLNLFAEFTSKEDSYFKSLLVTEYDGEKTDYGIVGGKAYKDGHTLGRSETLYL